MGIIGGILGIVNTIILTIYYFRDRNYFMTVEILSHGNETDDDGKVTFKIINKSKRSASIRAISLFAKVNPKYGVMLISDEVTMEQKFSIPGELGSDRRIEGKFDKNISSANRSEYFWIEVEIDTGKKFKSRSANFSS